MLRLVTPPERPFSQHILDSEVDTFASSSVSRVHSSRCDVSQGSQVDVNAVGISFLLGQHFSTLNDWSVAHWNAVLEGSKVHSPSCTRNCSRT